MQIYGHDGELQLFGDRSLEPSARLGGNEKNSSIEQETAEHRVLNGTKNMPMKVAKQGIILLRLWKPGIDKGG